MEEALRPPNMFLVFLDGVSYWYVIVKAGCFSLGMLFAAYDLHLPRI